MMGNALTRPAAKPVSYLDQPLDEIIGTVGNLRVLRSLFRHGGAIGTSRIVLETRLSREGVRKALRDLVDLRIVREVGTGHSVSYAVDERHPQHAILLGLFQGEQGSRDKVLEAIKAASAPSDFAGVYIFGSVARYEDHRDSDVDVLVISKVDDPFLHEQQADQFRGRLDQETALYGRQVSVIALRPAEMMTCIREKASIWENVKDHGRVIRGSSPSTLEMRMKRRELLAD